MPDYTYDIMTDKEKQVWGKGFFSGLIFSGLVVVIILIFLMVVLE